MDLSTQVQYMLKKAGNPIHGRDSGDDELYYSSIVEWRQTALKEQGEAVLVDTATTTNKRNKDQPLTFQQWYKTGYDYYEDELKCPATVDGVLGGFACLSSPDLKGSASFMRHVKSIRPVKFTKKENGDIDTCACECGAGIGRVSKGLLLPLGISQCDLVEPSPRLIASAPEYLGDAYSSRCRFFCTGMQDFEPNPQSYDIIWIQWVIGYLPDEDLVDFLKRCCIALRKGGVVVIKDNTCTSDAFIVDRDDASVTRSLPYILALVELAGMRVVYERYQSDFPDNIFPVPMLALEPKAEINL
jgi:protein N-terminal methyltransferase